MTIENLKNRWKRLNEKLNVKSGELYQYREEKYQSRDAEHKAGTHTRHTRRPPPPKVDEVAGSEFM